MEISLPTPISMSTLGRVLQRCHAKLCESWPSRHKQRSLLIKESAGLGERRFVAVIQFERQRFLIGGSPGSVALLAILRDEATGDQPQ